MSNCTSSPRLLSTTTTSDVAASPVNNLASLVTQSSPHSTTSQAASNQSIGSSNSHSRRLTLVDIHNIQNGVIRSKPSSVKVFCRFVNCTNRLVAPVWIDFSGRRVRYPCVKPGGCLNVETYENYPWCFLDAQDLSILLSSNQGAIFWPRHNIPDSALPLCIVKIFLPNFSLLELSLQAINRFDLPTFTLPDCLQDLLKTRSKYSNQISFVINPEGENKL